VHFVVVPHGIGLMIGLSLLGLCICVVLYIAYAVPHTVLRSMMYVHNLVWCTVTTCLPSVRGARHHIRNVYALSNQHKYVCDQQHHTAFVQPSQHHLCLTPCLAMVDRKREMWTYCNGVLFA
jgi:hypothetical protein